MENMTFISPSTQKRIEFLESLKADLCRIGHNIEISYDHNDIEIHFSPLNFSNLNDNDLRDLMKNAFEDLKKEKLNEEKNMKFILEMEENGIQNFFVESSDIELEAIKPKVIICNTNDLKRIFRYCRYFQTVPNSSGVGRRFSAIILDVGQSQEKIIGVIGLQSATRSSAARDTFLGWDSIDSRIESKKIRNIGLKRTMQLAIVTAIPPYSYLFGSKLIALLALSNPIQEYFNQRYNNPLLAVFTTCAYGLHSAMYNRIQLNKIHSKLDAYKTYNNEMYRRVGETNLFSQIMISNQTSSLAKEMFAKLPNTRTGSSFRTTMSKSRAISKSLRVCGLSNKVLYMYPMGIYIGFLHKNNIDVLKNGIESTSNAMLNLEVDSVVRYWKNEILQKKIKSHHLDQINKHTVQSILLSNYQKKE